MEESQVGGCEMVALYPGSLAAAEVLRWIKVRRGVFREQVQGRVGDVKGVVLLGRRRVRDKAQGLEGGTQVDHVDD
jgi:hypothetical protein